MIYGRHLNNEKDTRSMGVSIDSENGYVEHHRWGGKDA